MDLNLGQLVIELAGDYSQLTKDIESAKTLALKQAKELEKNFQLSPSFDAKSLLTSADLAGVNAGKALGRGIEKSLNSYKFSNTSFKSAGDAIAQGLSQGIKNGDSQVKNSASRMAGLVIDETRTKLKIHSPSKVFEEIGGEIVAGLAAGLGVSGALSISGFISGIINDAKSAVSATLSFAGDSINKASDLKATTTQLTALVGSTTNATESLKFLRSEADKLALPFLESTKAYTQLTAATNGTKLSSSTKDIFDGFSTAARAAQLSTVDFSGAMLGLIQMIGKGKITSQDLRQITDRLPGAMQLAAKSVGLTAAEFQKLSESGELTTNVFLPRFAKALKEANVGTIAEATDTSTASLTKLNNRLDEVKIALGAAIEPGVVAGLGFAEQALNELGKAGLFDDLNAGAKEFASYLKDNPQLARQLAQEFRSTVQTALKNVVGAAKDLGDYLQKNPDAIHRSVEAVGSFVNSLKDAVNVAGQLIKPFADIANFALQTEQRLANAVKPVAKNPNSNSSPARDIEDVSPVLRPVVKLSQWLGFNKEIGDRNSKSMGVIRPVDGAITSGFGERVAPRAGASTFHQGIDIGIPIGTPVKAPTAGVVTGASGNTLTLESIDAQGDKIVQKFLHLSSFLKKVGDVVSQGDVIAKSGNEGISTGPHLHYGTFVNGKAINPLEFERNFAKTNITVPSSNRQVISQARQQSMPTASEGWMQTLASTYSTHDGQSQTETQTASGILLDDSKLTAAINENLKKNLHINFGDRVEALNPANGKSVVVVVTDSGPYEKCGGKYVPHSSRGFDLSTAANNAIGLNGLGTIDFRVLGKNGQAQAIAQAQSTTATGTTTGLGQQPPEIRAILEGEKLKEAQARRQKLREAAAQLAQYQAEQRNIRARGVNFDSRSADNSILARQVAGLKDLQSLSPTDTRLDSLPSLERELALKQTQLDLDRKLAQVTDAENKNDISSTEANARVTQLQKENDVLVANINIQYQAATAARTLAKAKLELNSLVRDNTSKSEFLKQDAQLSEYGFGGNKLVLDRDSNNLDLQSKYASDKVSLLERAKLEGLNPEQTNGEKLRLALRYNQSNLLNNVQFTRSSQDEAFSNSQNLGRSNIDVLTARSEQLQGLGLSGSDKGIQKQIAITTQDLSYQLQIQDLQKLRDTTSLSNADFVKMKTNIEQINAIKLDTINQSFSDLSDVIKSVQSDFQSTTKDFILNTSNIGQSIGKLLNGILSSFANLASQQLSNQLFGALLGNKQTSPSQNLGGGFGSLLSSVGGLLGIGSNSGSGLDYSSFLDSGVGDSFSLIPGFSAGGMITDSLNRERSMSGGRNPMLVVANDGERILNPQETKVYNRLLSSGRLPNYASGGMLGGQPVMSGGI
ncbi:MAG: tape measure protein [Nostoc sp.]